MSAPGQITVVARWQTTAGAVGEILAIAAQLRPKSLAEPGCLGYEVYYSADVPGSVLLLERYRDDAALEAHKQTEHYKTLVMARVLPLLTDRRVEIFRA